MRLSRESPAHVPPVIAPLHFAHECLVKPACKERTPIAEVEIPCFERQARCHTRNSGLCLVRTYRYVHIYI